MRYFVWIIAAYAMVIGTPGWACPLGDVTAAVATGDLTRVVAAHQHVIAMGSACSADQRAASGAYAASMHAVAAERVLRAGGSIQQAEGLVAEGRRIRDVWMLQELKGDLIVRRAGNARHVDWAAAGNAFGCALERLAKDEEIPLADPGPVVLRIQRKAEQAQQHASRLIEPCGVLGPGRRAIDLSVIQRFTVVETVQPIAFPFDSVEFTPFGEVAVERLARTLLVEEYRRITLIGHTDPVGSYEYNMALSLRRADRVKQFLVKRGYPAHLIAVEGRGQREPIQPVHGIVYEKDQLHQLLRRVVLRRE